MSTRRQVKEVASEAASIEKDRKEGKVSNGEQRYHPRPCPGGEEPRKTRRRDTRPIRAGRRRRAAPPQSTSST
jgi:hypothetical protein